ncbi:hypothetical protein NDA18_001413 [Ustilago nuda]|nr:hypothetical protein NDA18_001413 [Ustilago nuda]
MPLLMVGSVRNPIAARRILSSAPRFHTVSRMVPRSSLLSKLRPSSSFILGASQQLHSVGLRTFTATPDRKQPTSPNAASSVCSMEAQGKALATYTGPLASTFTRLKLFSLGSLGLATVLTPILLLAPGEISLAGRVGLCITALATSGVSTALIAWIGTPYVGTMRLLQPSGTRSLGEIRKEEDEKVVMELNTVSWRLKRQKTLVYEPHFLRPTSRPFASWEITNSPPPLALSQAEGKEVVKKVAETFDWKTGASLGVWSVKYTRQAQQKGQGEAAEPYKMVAKTEVAGKPNRYFNVHEELLGQDWQVLG